jgi:hypothetical protein
MAIVRSDIRERVRDYLYEATANLLTDAQLNRFFLEELRGLPSQNIYKEEIYTTSLVVDQQSYALPTGVIKAEKLERNDGTTADPLWVTLSGWDVYGDALYLDWLPTDTDTIRAHIKMKFTDITDDSTSLDVPDDKTEVLVWGTVCKAYKALLGYKKGDLSWDSVTRPGDLSLTSLQAWYREARDEYKRLIQQYKTTPRPRDIDLVS